MVFGVDKKGKKIYNHSLFDAIKGVDDEEDRKKLAQITINRLIFVKFIESKGWINNNPRFLKELKDGFARNPSPGGFYRTYLEPLFFRALNEHGMNKPHPYENVRYLNGGLFRKGSTESKYPSYDISNDELLKVIDFLEEYSFEIKGAEKIEDGIHALDPEILGYIFERTANHEAGAYYTPENITTYIADQTIESLILERVNAYLKEKGKPERKDLYTIFGEGGLDIDDLRNLYEKRKILDVKVLDPACGSGAFFIPAIRKLLDLNKKFYKEINRGEPDTYQLQKKIVENDIYGVDINSEAVEIAKLRLWLDLLDAVDDINRVDSLPNIEYNVMAGNSLIGAIEIPEDSRAAFYTYYHPIKFEQMLNMYPDFVEECKKLTKAGEQFEATLNDILLLRNKLVAKYREETHPVYAARLREVIQEMSEVFRDEIGKVYLHKMLGTSNGGELEEVKKKLKPFHWGVEFSDVFERGGFDVVIGNPPWVESRKFGELEKALYEHIFTVAKKQYDLFTLFIERSFYQLKKSGSLGFIVPDRFITNLDYWPFRKFLLEHYLINRLLHMGDGVFSEVRMPSAILIIRKDGVLTKENHLVRYAISKDQSVSDLVYNEKPQADFLKPDLYLFSIFSDKGSESIVKKIDESSVPLGDLVFNGRGVEIGKTSSLITKEKTNETSVPFLVGEDIDKYKLKSDKYLVLGGKDVDYKDPSLYAGPKILIRKTGKGIRAVLDKEGHYVIQVIYIFKKKDPRIEEAYIVGVLNSHLMNFYYFSVFGEKDRKTFPHLTQGKILKLPIKIASKAQQEKVGKLVGELTKLNSSMSGKDEHAKSKMNSLKKEIDSIIYSIYGLSESDIESIEETFS